MKQNNHHLGQITEAAAAEYLHSNGYQIIERNYHNRFGEIDIIARDNKTLVFVEVKAKTGVEFGSPEEMVGKSKLAKVRRMGSLYMEDKMLPCRIDVVAIVVDKNETITRLTHYQNVY